ncbi:anion transporter [Methylosinus sp. H3A]|uniref:anion transporter n=1 Tax=Methylosinus sp. H3A TaxID=2785786 RepID=UPI0018C2646F|nr:anion transporter [Methylosinus sp. H3A]MBG0808301.1 anion transporter [Methylosinus sp. H3A]
MLDSGDKKSSSFASALVAVALVFFGALAAAAGVTLLARLAMLFFAAAPDGAHVAAVIVFAATYFVIALGEAPGLRLDRAGAALLGASLMVGLGVLPLDEAYRAIDFDTITLLLGMMIVVANLRLSGFFRLASNFVVTRAKSPLALLAAIVLVTGAFSAFLVNDAICLVMTPLALELTKRLKRDPLPYLLAVPMASNVGSVATITGNPQNMIIGGLSHIPYGAFAAALWPVAAFGLLVTFALLALFYPREFLSRERLPEAAPPPARARGFLVFKSVSVTLAMMGLFFAGQPVAKVAIVGGALLLVTRHVKAEKVYREIDWPLLLMFVGLFIVVQGLEATVLTPQAVASIGNFDLSDAGVLAIVSAILSNLVSNVPAVLALKPFVAGAADPQRAWLVVAMASTLAGNLTLIGSVANLIVAERARAAGVSIGFWAYFKIGAPLTLVTIAFGAWLLS